jgi:hypothetical protein
LRATAAGGGGTGIAFDTDNEGDWLYVQANDETAAGGAPHGQTIELRDRAASGGIRLDTFNQLSLISSGLALLQSRANVARVQSDAASSPAIELKALSGQINLTGDSAHFQGSGAGAFLDLNSAGDVLISGNAGVAVVSPGDIELESDTVIRFLSPAGTTVLEVRADGTFHILSGAAWVADL